MVLVLLDDGTPWLLRTDAGADGSATLVEEAAPPTPTPSLVAASVFYDRSGLFAPATAAAERADANMAAAGAAADATGGAAEGDGEESEDEDDLALYGRAPEKAAAEPAATAAEVLRGAMGLRGGVGGCSVPFESSGRPSRGPAGTGGAGPPKIRGNLKPQGSAAGGGPISLR